MSTGLHDLTCRDCGRPVRRHGRTGALIHGSGGPVAACDLDSDHPPRPDWSAVADLRCGRCGAPLHASTSGALTHHDASLNDDHTADPWASSQ